MRRNHVVVGRWIRIVAIVVGILCVLGSVLRRGNSAISVNRTPSGPPANGAGAP